MTTTAVAPRPTTKLRTAPLWKTGVLAAVLAAVATTIVAAVAMGAGVPVEIDGEPIMLVGFAELTLLFTAVGLVIAKALARWAARPRRTFTATTVALTALSVVPDLTFPATTATRVVLIVTHLVAAAIVIPAVARSLPDRTR